MFQNKPLHDPQLVGGTGVVLTAAILRGLVQRKVISAADAHKIVADALTSIEGMNVTWANVARDLIEQRFLPAFRKA